MLHDRRLRGIKNKEDNGYQQVSKTKDLDLSRTLHGVRGGLSLFIRVTHQKGPTSAKPCTLSDLDSKVSSPKASDYLGWHYELVC
jgi:hypothetical protein